MFRLLYVALMDDLKRKQEINSFVFEELTGERCLLICALILMIGLLIDLARFL